MPQIEPRMISNQLQSSVFLYTCQSADVMEILKKVRQKMDAARIIISSYGLHFSVRGSEGACTGSW